MTALAVETDEVIWVRRLERFMERYGGKPVWDGRTFRCPDCNGGVEEKLTDHDGEGREVRPHRALICRTCRRRSRVGVEKLLAAAASSPRARTA